MAMAKYPAKLLTPLLELYTLMAKLEGYLSHHRLTEHGEGQLTVQRGSTCIAFPLGDPLQLHV